MYNILINYDIAVFSHADTSMNTNTNVNVDVDGYVNVNVDGYALINNRNAYIHKVL